ncbi:MAG: hypothetical protein IT210_21430 [Armatimonadetes bacterium]|nr:hypothetical protein [Armatimonadota bacterium]
MYLDHSVYPDVEALPESLDSDEERADYIERICAAWDFDIFPEPETFDLLIEWKSVFDRYPLPYSPAYHTFRRIFGWEPVAYPAEGRVGHLTYRVKDRLEDRGPDPCEAMV